jgi:hypothetical protein
MRDELGLIERKRNSNGLVQHYQNILTQSLLNALGNFKTEDWTMSINDATPSEWDRLRKEHPALEVSKPTIDESLMKAYLDLAQEEFDNEGRKSEWWRQHVARKEQAEYEARWVDESLEEIIARQDEEEKDMSNEELTSYIFEEDEDVVNSPNHYNNGSIECIEGIQASMSTEAFAGYLKGNCMKYLWRYDYKGKPVEDLQKAQWYLAKLLNVVVFEEGEE